MNKRRLLTTVLILITAVSLGAAVFFYNQLNSYQETRPLDQLKHKPVNSTPSGGTAPEQESSPGGSIQPATGSGTSGGQETPLTGGASGGNNGGETDGGQTGGGQTSPGPGSLQAQIEQKYTDRLQSVGAGYEGRLNGLVAAALNDYQAAKTADPNADITPLANKYYAEGQALQAECDAKMYAILDAFENELRANSLPVDAALNARATYESTKSNRANQLLSTQP